MDNKIAEINWNSFKAKFDGNESTAFESMCYFLFCKEYDRSTGIQRYKNQAGIETDPIEKNGKLIGFQVKYYTTRLSEKKEDIIDSIQKAKEKNPNIHKIVFYLNQEFSESSKKDCKEPSYKIDIEDFAQSRGIEIDWRCRSFFDSPFVREQNYPLVNHYFSAEKGIYDFMKELMQHTERLFSPIRSSIIYNEKEIKINRSKEREIIEDNANEQSIFIITGIGGSGKTALIKDFYNQIKDISPFFIFKASEFNISSVNDLFKSYGAFTFLDFIEEFHDIHTKMIVIDSVEIILDLENNDAFQEFCSGLFDNEWSLFITIRNSYLDDITNLLINIFSKKIIKIQLTGLDKEQLIKYSEEYGFDLPQNDRLVELIANPFYLKEYLALSNEIDNAISFSKFKELIWKKHILKSSNRSSEREKCIIKIAKLRAEKGFFYVQCPETDQEIYANLIKDEILGYDDRFNGYYFTHDIFEEWALNKIIDIAFKQSSDIKEFFNEIGCSLPIRRAFRLWLSEQLIINQVGGKSLIESTMIIQDIESHWKDEVLISSLSSDYVELFIQIFEDKLYEDNNRLLIRIIFLLRMACKERDESLMNQLGMNDKVRAGFETIFTKPKGKGWHCVIESIYKHLSELGLNNKQYIIPLLIEWNSKNKNGETTKYASMTALFYYQEIVKMGGFRNLSDNSTQNLLIKIMLFGASEIQVELRAIFDDILLHKPDDNRYSYNEMANIILSSFPDHPEIIEVIKYMPEYVIKLADHFWFKKPAIESKGYHFSIRDIEDRDIEDDFGISIKNYRYHPVSAYQTPLYLLLKNHPKMTLDFIVEFINKSSEVYAKSTFNNEIKEIDIIINENKTIKQYSSDRLWNMYRGTEVSSYLLESIHMALEKWLLEIAQSVAKDTVEEICLFLLKKSKSVSITAVVASVVLAQPSKLFNIAMILFKTKELLFYDKRRQFKDQSSAKSLYSIGYGLNQRQSMYYEERVKTCDEPHRKLSLETLALQYQIKKDKDESDDDLNQRRKAIWDLFDSYYKELASIPREADEANTWRMFLARMDARKMDIKITEENDKIIWEWYPKLEPELKKISDDSTQEYINSRKYMELYIWASSRIKNDDQYKKYPKYEQNPKLVFRETKMLLDEIQEDKELLNASIPAYTCSVLIRDYYDDLDDDEKQFCKNSIFVNLSMHLRNENYYTCMDEVKAALSSFPHLFKYFIDDREMIKTSILLLLICQSSKIRDIAIDIFSTQFWSLSFQDAQSIFLGYLILKPKYDTFFMEQRREVFMNNNELSKNSIIEAFIEKYSSLFENINNNTITFEYIDSLNNLNIELMINGFRLLPLETVDADHMIYLTLLFEKISGILFLKYQSESYELIHYFLERFALFILSLSRDKIKDYLKPFVDNFKVSEAAVDFFQEFILVNDSLNRYEEFWIVWNCFYINIIDICKKRNSDQVTNGIIRTYFLAGKYWKEDASEWHSLKDREKIFYQKATDEIGRHPSVLYSITKILNGIGSPFYEDGIFWIGMIICKNPDLISVELEIDTLFYLENIVRRYSIFNKKKIKESIQIKGDFVGV